MLSFTVSRTYNLYTPPDDPEAEAVEGEDESGFVYEDRVMGFRDVVDELKEMTQLSCYPACCSRGGHHPCWASQEHQVVSYADGQTRSEAVHISEVNGKPIKPTQLARLFRVAGLMK